MRKTLAFIPLVLAGFAVGATACSGKVVNAQGEPYQGYVLAASSSSWCGTGQFVDYDVEAMFQTAQASPGPVAALGCSCTRGQSGGGVVVDPSAYPAAPAPPNAGNLSITTAQGKALATLTPTQTEADWTHATWSAGVLLEVSASGDTIDGFTGALRTAVLPSGLTPSLWGSSVRVDRNEDFELSWTPGAYGTDSVSLQILDDCGPSCSCAAPMSAGKITVDRADLATFDSQTAESCNTTMWLMVTSTSTAPSGNATIQLVGQSTLTVTVAFE